MWFKSSMDQHGEAIGATVDAESVNLGEDGAFSTNIMVKMPVTTDNGSASATCFLARAFGPTIQEARDGLSRLLSSPERLEAETEDWWNTYLNEVPHLETPDESFSKTFLWSWPDFRMNQIDVPIGPAPPGLHNSNNARISVRLWVGAGDHVKPGQSICCTIREPFATCSSSYSRTPENTGFSFPGLPMAANRNVATPPVWGTSVGFCTSTC